MGVTFICDYTVHKTQKEGACIGSGVAPTLAEVSLYVLDCKASDLVIEKEKHNLLVGRYVDDIAIYSVQQEDALSLKDALVESCPELSFMVELLVNGAIQFLDFRLSLNEGLS